MYVKYIFNSNYIDIRCKMTNNKSLPNLYEILNVSQRAEPEVIKAAYRALMFKYHSDKTGDDRIAVQLNTAKEILLDPDKRAKYDEDTYGNKEGKIIGNYRILKLIAEGGFGKTYKGEHIILEELVCIKHAHYISPQDEEILRKEAKSIWDLRHHSLPAMRDMVRLDDGSFALVMSYIPGPTLEQIIKKNGKLEPEHVAWISERALSALWYLHLNGIVHGDVKPQNIIIQPESHAIVLVDYGLAAIKPSHNSQAIGYTPYFASPEQEKGGPLIPESDFYGLGMTMIYALGGDLGKKRIPSSVPDVLSDFIADLIVHDVNSRPKWEDGNIIERLSEIRQKAFGRKRSNMTKIPNF